MNWRTLTLLVILANLFYWAWNAWIEQPEIVGLEDHRIIDVPLLELASQDGSEKTATKVLQVETSIDVEAALSKSTDETESTVSIDESNASIDPVDELADGLVDDSVIVPGTTVCRRIGAFVNEQDATDAAAWLETEGFQTNKKIAMDMVWLGYWVYMPQYPNREAAEQVVMALREKGVKDMFIEIAEPNQNAVSLGLYRQRSGAESRLRQIQAQGYAARIGNKEREQAVFWLETQIEADREIPINRLSSPSGQVRRIEIKDCQ